MKRLIPVATCTLIILVTFAGCSNSKHGVKCPSLAEWFPTLVVRYQNDLTVVASAVNSHTLSGIQTAVPIIADGRSTIEAKAVPTEGVVFKAALVNEYDAVLSDLEEFARTGSFTLAQQSKGATVTAQRAKAANDLDAYCGVTT